MTCLQVGGDVVSRDAMERQREGERGRRVYEGAWRPEEARAGDADVCRHRAWWRICGARGRLRRTGGVVRWPGWAVR